MDFIGLFGIAVGLSMDAFAVAVCKGLGMKRVDVRQAVVIALFFGAVPRAHAAGRLGCWARSSSASSRRWTIGSPSRFWPSSARRCCGTAFMAKGARNAAAIAAQPSAKLDLRELVMLSVATSIDALAVGITFAFLRVDIGLSAALIGTTTFLLSFTGVAVGNRFGARFERAGHRSPAASCSSSSAPRSCWNTSA